jgi:hypothetical protein
VEVLYADERHFRIYDGAGTVQDAEGNIVPLVEIPNGSTTATEYPTVADVDGDGAAEIVVPANNHGKFFGVRVFEPAQGHWAATRKLWNQHSYHIGNIEDDGHIPAQEEPSWLAHNSYRLNRFLDRDPLAGADLSLARLSLTDHGQGQPMSLAVRLGNGGTRVPPAPVRVAFYRGDPAAGGTLLGQIEVPDLPAPGWRELGLDGVPLGVGELYAVADPQGAVDECDEGNNALSIPGDAAQSLGALTLSTDAASYGPASPVAIAVQASNPGSFPALYRLELVVEDAAGAEVERLDVPPLEPLAPGAAAEPAQDKTRDKTRGKTWTKRGQTRDGRRWQGCYAVHKYSIAPDSSRIPTWTWSPSDRDADLPLTVAAIPRERACTGSCSSTWRPTSRWPGKTIGTASGCPSTWNGSFGVTWNAASWPTASLGPAAPRADTISWWPSPARGAASAPRATLGAWPRPPPTWSIGSSRPCRCASGCCRYPSGCAGTWNVSQRRSRPCCTSSCGWSRPICADALPGPRHGPASGQ